MSNKTNNPVLPGQEHAHVDALGRTVSCLHKCKSVLMDGSFWIGTLIAFPLEHFIWERIWPFSWLTQIMGL